MRSIGGFNSNAIQGSFQAGDSISASALNKLAAAADSGGAMMSNDVTFFAGTTGVSYGITPSVYYAPTSNPLDPSLSGDKVTVVPGTVNRYIPKIGANYIDENPAPTITVTDSGYIMVEASYEANKYFPRTAVIVFQAVSTPPADTNDKSYYPLAKVIKTTVASVDSYSLQLFQNGNLVVNRLKAGENIATWWWTRV